MATVTVERSLFGLSVVAPAGHPATALLNRLPRALCLRPTRGTDEYIVALSPDVLVPLRHLFRLPDVAFSAGAILALASLSERKGGAAPPRAAKGTAAEKAPQRPAEGHARVIVAPEVSANLRGLACSTDPIEPAANGDSTLPTMGGNSFEETIL